VVECEILGKLVQKKDKIHLSITLSCPRSMGVWSSSLESTNTSGCFVYGHLGTLLCLQQTILDHSSEMAEV